MHNFTTVFEITAGTNGIQEEAMLRLVIGVIILIGGIIGFVLRKRTQGRFPKKLWTPAFMTFWGFIWLCISIPIWQKEISDINHFLEIYRNGKCQIVEGIVQVSHEQPASGHTAGDKITVDGQEFEVNYFMVTPGYNITISHGGALREGVFARLHYYNGVILKVEIRKKES